MHNKNRRRRIEEQELIDSYETFALLSELYSNNRPVMLEIALANSYWEQQLLQEGWGTDLAMKALQFVMSSVVEYGIAIGTLGAGAAGPAEAAETLVDGLFTSASVAEILSALVGVFTAAKEFAGIFNGAVNAVKSGASDLKGLYNSICQIVGNGLSLLGSKAQGSVDSAVEKYANKLKNVVAKMVKKIVGGINSVIKLFIPDAIIGTTVAEGFEMILNAMSKKCYSMISIVIDKAGIFGKFFTDPAKAPALFESWLKSLAGAIEGVIKKIEDAGIIKTLMAGPTGILFKTVGKAGLKKLLSFINEKSKGLLTLIRDISNKFIPAVWSILGLAQCLLAGDYKQFITAKNKKSPDEKSKEKQSEPETSDAKEKGAEEADVSDAKILKTGETKKKGRSPRGAKR